MRETRKDGLGDAYRSTAQQVLEALETHSDGLSQSEAERRISVYGFNKLKEKRRQSAFSRLLRQFNNILIYVLIAAGFITLLLGQWLDASVIFGVVVINAVIGFVQEGRAERAMESIRAMLSTQARVMRDTEQRVLDAAHLVPGDLVLLESGDRVPADARLLRTHSLRVDESSLTGESVPVDKQSEVIDEERVLAERDNMLWSGTLVVSGRGRALVVATGEDTELGRIKQATESVHAIDTPLLRKIDQLGRQLTVVILVLSLVSFLVGFLWRGRDMADMFMAAVGLAVAAIPEGLPAVITITLALGMQIMARRQAIVRRLPAVETLGSVTVICSDKTGTLTRNEMTVRGLVTQAGHYAVSGSGYNLEGRIQGRGDNDIKVNEGENGDRALDELLLAGLLCNESSLRREEETLRISGDPMEAALLVLAEKAELDIQQTHGEWPRADWIPFESERRYMATLNHDHTGHGRIYLKGAPELIFSRCQECLGPDGRPQPMNPAQWRAQVENLAAKGQRTLALARITPAPGQHELEEAQLTEGLCLIGLVALEDPPRTEAIRAVADCHQAGIRVKLITGDHLGTALAIGQQLGIGDGKRGMSGGEFHSLSDAEVDDIAQTVDVFARFSPEDKLRLVKGLRRRWEVTAMTGDGVNDSPALRSADVGVAMGQKGTAAAREASEIVLADDNFATIASAVRTGRAIYDNIRKSLLFILPTNGGQALLVLFAVVAGLTLPVTPVQILWVNMVTAVTLALALAFEPPEDDVMHRPPRPPGEPVLTPFLLWRVTFVSLLILAATFWVFYWHLSQGMALGVARTAAVNTVVASEIVYLFNCRYLCRPVLSFKGLTGNPWVPGAVALVVLLQIAFTHWSPLQSLFRTQNLTLASWGWIAAVSLPIFLIVEWEKRFWEKRLSVRAG